MVVSLLNISRLKDRAKRGLPGSLTLLGWCYLYGEGVEKDYARAHRLLKQASDQGVATGSLLFGTLYEHGLGVQQDMSRAIALYEIAARTGHTDALLYLARIYRAGKGVTKDVRAAVRAYQKVFVPELSVDDPLWQAVHEAKIFLDRMGQSRAAVRLGHR